MLEHVAMYVARLRSGGRKHYNMRSVLRGIFWNVHSVSCMSGAAGDGRTIHTYIHIYIYINNSRMNVSSMWGSLRLAPIIIFLQWHQLGLVTAKVVAGPLTERSVDSLQSSAVLQGSSCKTD